MTFLFGTNSPVTPSSQSISAPSQAAAFGYNTLTFGPSPAIGVNWFNFNLLSSTPNAGQSVQNSDGSVTCCPSGISQGGTAALCTAYSPGSGWKGIAFGGGFYVEAKISFVTTAGVGGLPFPAFWADDINFLSQAGGVLQWSGQAAGYSHWVELDFMQWSNNNTTAYVAMTGLIDWYGLPSYSTVSQPTNSLIQFNHLPNLATPPNPANYNTYGCLWVPATATSPGFVRSYFNGLPVDYVVGTPATALTWNLYNPSSPPPPVIGTTAGSRLDTQKMALLLSASATNPMTVASVSVWQASTAGNLVQ